jgi:tRNA threonylcarbamoyladenosine biosynthesis protein TsaE
MIQEGTRFRSVGLSELREVAESIAGRVNDIKVWLFQGDLGAGKTTLIKMIGEALGVADSMSSPTFAIVNEYEGRNFKKIFHFDCYRLKTEAEAYDIGMEEYLYSGYPCFIEWPDRIPSLIPAKHASVTITSETQTQRTIAILVHDGKEENRI